MRASTEWRSSDENPQGFLAQSESGHSVRFDTSSSHGEGPSPMEIVLMGLCGCTSVDVVIVLRKKRQPLASLTVSATAEQATEFPRVFTKIHLIYRVSAEAGGTLSRKAVEDAIDLSKDKYCSVSAMLAKSAEIDFSIEFADGEPES